MLELSARWQNTWQCIYRDWKTLENQLTNLKTHFGLEGIPSKHFSCSEEGLNSSSNCSFIAVYCKHFSCQLSSVNFDVVTASNCHAHARIGQIVIAA